MTASTIETDGFLAAIRPDEIGRLAFYIVVVVTGEIACVCRQVLAALQEVSFGTIDEKFTVPDALECDQRAFHIHAVEDVAKPFPLLADQNARHG